ncbi:ribonuclease H-like domain-containing protein [Tanacetum coccineum]|uniref:Ribonuclease H-like domain-containing protein n=1 Tax=Tanacetum coccineum TaxID=301880 RepID=A0ABQ5HC26_9ASTR
MGWLLVATIQPAGQDLASIIIRSNPDSTHAMITHSRLDVSISRYEARIVTNGRCQHIGVDCDETFNLVVKAATIRTVLSLAASRHWHVHQLDVKNTFLRGHLSETSSVAGFFQGPPCPNCWNLTY